MKTFAFQMKNGQSAVGQNTSHNENNVTVTENRKRKVFGSLKTVGLLLVILVVFTGPFVVLMFLTVFNVNPSYSSIFAVCGLACFNSVLNPIVYGWKLHSVRKEVKLLFEPCFARLNNDQAA
jgi:uncharacterized membrane protein YqjE